MKDQTHRNTGGVHAARRPTGRNRSIKRSEVVALNIVRDIVEQRLGPGDRLPVEPELIERYGVSRASLREALRLLEVQGLIRVRPGPGAGTVVGEVDPANLAATLSWHLHMAGSTFAQLLHAWLIVEPIMARLAAGSADREAVGYQLEPFVSGAAGEDRHPDSGLSFHDTVAELAGNSVLTLLLGAIGSLVTEQIKLVAPEFQLSGETLHAHRELAQKIIEGDEAAAHRIMHQHVEQVIEEIREVAPTRIDKSLLLSVPGH